MTKELSFFQKVSAIQAGLNAPKNGYNTFGKYKYRNIESILEALKPYLEQYDLVIKFNDDIVFITGRFYVKATAIISDGKENMEATAFAREEETKRGMDASQITGSASSYARKYALGGLLAIDDGQDADSRDNTNKSSKTKAATKAPAKGVSKAVAKDTLPETKENTLKLLNNKINDKDLKSLDDCTRLYAEMQSYVHGGNLTRADLTNAWEDLKTFADIQFNAEFNKDAKSFVQRIIVSN